jgi:hypothetical protein
MVSGATTAFVVQRSVDNTTSNVGFTGAGVVNTATVDAFCNASVTGVISRNCWIQGIVDQTGNGCLIYNSTASAMPNYMVAPAHSGLPLFQKAFQGSTSNLNFLLDNNGGSTASLTNPCNTLTGGAQALFYAGSDSYASNIGGQAGLQENIPGVVTGTMWSAFVGIPGLVFGSCPVAPSNFCGGLDTEGEGPQQAFVNAGISDVIQVLTTAGGTGPSNLYAQQPPNASGQIAVNQTIAHALVTQARMSWGATGDHTSNGPAMVRSEAFFTQDFGSASSTASALMANEASFIATLSAGYQGPGDLFVENSTTPGLSTGHIDQMQWLSECRSLRKCYAGYEGPAANVCQGSGSCEDIGWVNNVFDVATASAYCGPVSGLNNCAVQIWYNQALNQNSLVNTLSTANDAVAVSSSHRPALAFSGCPTTTITVCVLTTTTNYFTVSGGSGISTGGYTLAAVAARTSGTALSAIYSSTTGTGPETFLGFAASANNCFGQAHNGGGSGVTVACTDGVVHALVYDVANTPSANLYVDGTAGTAVTSSIGISTVGLGVGATGAGADTCTCQLSEVLVYADTHAATFPTGIGPTGVATLRANQRAAYGF